MINTFRENRVIVRGAGEMASGVIKRLFAAGYEVVALEQKSPTCIRRTVCFAEAVYHGEVIIEGITARFAESPSLAVKMLADNIIPVLVDPDAKSLSIFVPIAVVDARMLKKNIETTIDMAPIVIGLGPGFVSGLNCHAAIETNRGVNLGCAIFTGSPQSYTGVPASVDGFTLERVLRSPGDGILNANRAIGDMVDAGDVVCEVADQTVESRFRGVIRGLARDGLKVGERQKIGDIDPRCIREYCFKISDKARAVGEGVLKAIVSLKRDLV